jgi:hypothetical protein
MAAGSWLIVYVAAGDNLGFRGISTIQTAAVNTLSTHLAPFSGFVA